VIDSFDKEGEEESARSTELAHALRGARRCSLAPVVAKSLAPNSLARAGARTSVSGGVRARGKSRARASFVLNTRSAANVLGRWLQPVIGCGEAQAEAIS
jgi:hypothetical protein